MSSKMVLAKPTSAATKGTKRKRNDENVPLSRTLDTFFAPQVVAPSTAASGEDVLTAQRVSLTSQQAAILRRVVDENKNVFFTGSAGTGKSLLLMAIIVALRKKYRVPGSVAVTASTGMAASKIGGMTLHSWGAINPTMPLFDAQVRSIRRIPAALQRWMEAKVLVIDEVSMIDAALFTRVNHLAQELRKNKLPLGGIQLVVTGDFFQLPPITKGGAVSFAFESPDWQKCIQHTLSLSQVFRQKDSAFVDLLNCLRVGVIPQASLQTFTSLSRELPLDATGIRPTQLFAVREEVARANTLRLDCLPGTQRMFNAQDSGLAVGEQREKLLNNMMAPRVLSLKPDAQVMLLKNLDTRLVNGTVGRVVGFYSPVEVQGDMQGKSSRGDVFVVRSVEMRNNLPVPPLEIDPIGVVERYPLIDFGIGDGTREAVLVGRVEFRIDDPLGKTLARRVQIPLTLAWAMSIHKSQGQTIQKLKVDLGRVFEKGQAYVALSRAASLEGLQVINFAANKVCAHPKVIEWAKTLETEKPTYNIEV